MLVMTPAFDVRSLRTIQLILGLRQLVSKASNLEPELCDVRPIQGRWYAMLLGNGFSL